MRSNIIFATLAAILFASNCSAEGIPIDPGKWEMTSTMKMSMMTQPQTSTTRKCIKEEVIAPETFSMNEEHPCKVTDVKLEENTASWSINCPVDNGAVMEGQWKVTSHGDSLVGNGTMVSEIAGQKVDFEMSWEGKRIGDCE